MLLACGVAYRYPSMPFDAVHPTTLQLEPGTFTVLTGPTGCGKSTLLRLFAGLLQRHGGGEARGTVSLNGMAVAGMTPSVRVRHIGFVGQNPDDQLVAGTLADEIAFAAESAGASAVDIATRVRRLLHQLGLPGEPDRPVRALSGGQRQRLVIAAALSGGGEVLLLDEPLAHLDPLGATELVVHLRRLADDGHVVVAVEHRLEAVYTASDRVVVMDQGRVVDDVPRNRLKATLLRGLGLVVPVDVALAADRPVGPLRVASPHELAPYGVIVLRTAPCTVGYHRGPSVVNVPGFTFVAGERVAIVGPNGAGKSTLLSAVNGELGPPISTCAGRIVAVPQDPDLSLFNATVRQELRYAPRDLGLPDDCAMLATTFSLSDLLERPPQALSRGQRLRTAVAAALAARPAVLALDEPTAGQDHDQVERLMAAITTAMAAGVVLFATHDLALAMRHATRVIVIAHGRLVADGPPAETLDRSDVAALLPLPGALGRCRARGISLAEVAHHGGPNVAVELLRALTP